MVNFSTFVPRHLSDALLEALKDTPVVFLNGPRQAGKSTLVRDGIAARYPCTYVTLDDDTHRDAARSDPVGFLSSFHRPLAIDEVQRAPGLFLPIKAEVDKHPEPGRFILTGSADMRVLPRLAEALVGRMEIVTLWPFSQGEILGVREGFLDAVFEESIPPLPEEEESRRDLFDRLLAGGYPGARSRLGPKRRGAWFRSAVLTILQREVLDIARIEGTTVLPRVLSLLAARAMSILNVSELSRSLAVPNMTLTRYLALLEGLFLVQLLPPWSGNLSKRLVRAPKAGLVDTGLLCHLLKLDSDRLLSEHTLQGPLLENFVFMELKKHLGWSRVRPDLYHFRSHERREVDLVLEEGPIGRVVGIEVKAAASVVSSDFKGLRALEEAVGDRFFRGIVLHTGMAAVAFGPRLHALPLSALWRLGTAPHSR